MAAERYYVTALSGYTIGPSGKTWGGQRPATTFTVHDRAYCHRDVAMFSTTSHRGVIEEERRLLAERLASTLNAAERAAA